MKKIVLALFSILALTSCSTTDNPFSLPSSSDMSSESSSGEPEKISFHYLEGSFADIGFARNLGIISNQGVNMSRTNSRTYLL